MSRVKLIALLVVGVLVVVFAVENWDPPSQPVKFLSMHFLPVPMFLIIYSCLFLGFVAGWLGHALRLRRRRQREQDQAWKESQNLRESQEQQGEGEERHHG